MTAYDHRTQFATDPGASQSEPEPGRRRNFDAPQDGDDRASGAPNGTVTAPGDTRPGHDAAPNDTVDAAPGTAARGTNDDMNEPAAAQTSSTERHSLFGDAELSDLRARWTAVQAEFVDAPKDCVHKADGLVAELLEQLTAGLAEARSRLEQPWARGEQASTEDLRVALTRYREFFERLLAV